VLFLELQPKMKNCGYRHSPGFLNKSNATGTTCGTGTSFHSGIPEFTPGFSAVRVARCLVLCVCFVDRCLSFCPFFLLAIVLSVILIHCIVCHSDSLYCLSILLRFTVSDYPFSIFKHFITVTEYLS